MAYLPILFFALVFGIGGAVFALRAVAIRDWAAKFWPNTLWRDTLLGPQYVSSFRFMGLILIGVAVLIVIACISGFYSVN